MTEGGSISSELLRDEEGGGGTGPSGCGAGPLGGVCMLKTFLKNHFHLTLQLSTVKTQMLLSRCLYSYKNPFHFYQLLNTNE